MKTYLFCNAHLDPVWLWQWESGLSEGLSTFRSAADLLDEYPDFVFNHNESLLYEWVQQHEPALFERIKKQVEQGRWKIVGGWFLQPDCNIPSGESIFRQVLRGRLYFYDNFGKVPVTAVNFDSFGHARGLVQMLSKCGYKYYVNIRPGRGEYDFDSEDFLWKGYEGSEIIVHRSDRGYNSVFGTAADEVVKFNEKWKENENGLFFWGVGNHGGGASRKDLNDLKTLKEQGYDILHSCPDEYFETVDRNGIPVVERGLNHIMQGCYTSIIRIKQMHRRLENDLVMVEKMASHACLAGLSDYEKALIDDAWRDLLFAEFHDSLPGSCIQPVEEDTLRILSHGLEITNRLKAKYFLALCSGQERIKDPETVPIMVYNPHPFTYDQPIDIEFLLPKQLWHKEFSNPVVYDENGNRLPCQSAKESGNFNMDWCKRVIFEAPLPPTSISRFNIGFEIIEKRPEPQLSSKWGYIVVETARGKVCVSCRTGLVDSYELDGREYFKKGALSVQVFKDSFNCWDGRPILDPRTPMGEFSLMSAGQATDFSGVKGRLVSPVRVTDEGEVNVVVEADMQYNLSRMLVRYIVNKISGILEMEIRVFYAESEKRLKLKVPAAFDNSKFMGQTIFGREGLGDDYRERLSQYWQALSDGEYALAVIDDGVYGSHCHGSEIGISLVRSAGYGAGRSAWGEPFHDPMYQPRMDQGERIYRFRFLAGTHERVMKEVDRQAAIFNQRAYGLAFCPSGKGEKPESLISIDKENVALSCFKQSERDPSVSIIRVFECQGNKADARIEIPVAGVFARISLAPFEIKTFRLSGGELTECDMLEGAVPLEN